MIALDSRLVLFSWALAGVACSPESELRVLHWPASLGASQLIAVDGTPPRVFAREGDQPVLLGGVSAPSLIRVLDYTQSLSELGLDAGTVEARSCRSCALLSPQHSYRTSIETDAAGEEQVWEPEVGMPDALQAMLLPDAEVHCGACPPLLLSEVLLPERGDVTFTGRVSAHEVIVAQETGHVLRIDDSGAHALCTIPAGINGAALRGTDELWTSSQDGVVRQLLLSQQADNLTCVSSSTLAVPNGAWFVRLAISDEPQARELVGVTLNSLVYHWYEGRWQNLGSLMPNEYPHHALWAGGRRFFAGASSDLVRIEAGQREPVLIPFRNPSGIAEIVEAIAIDPIRGLIAVVGRVGIVNGLDVGEPRISFANLMHVGSLVPYPNVLYWVTLEGQIGRSREGSPTCDLVSVDRGYGSAVSASLGEEGVLLGDTAHADTFDQQWVLRVEPQRGCPAP